METSRDTELFNLRYAERVLERHCRLWRKIDAAVRLAAVLSGTGAIAGLAAQNAPAAVAAGVLFALLQAVEYALRPSEVAAASLAQRKRYSELMARGRTLDAVALADNLAALRADDSVIVPESLRRLAFNDVVAERDLEDSTCFPATPLLRLMACLA